MTVLIGFIINLTASLVMGMVRKAIAASEKKEKPQKLNEAPQSPVEEDGTRIIPIVVGTALLSNLPITAGKLRYYRDRRSHSYPQRLGGNLEVSLTLYPFALLGLETNLPSGSPIQFRPVRDASGQVPNFFIPANTALRANSPYVMANPGTTAPLPGTSPPQSFPFTWTEPATKIINQQAHTAWWADYDLRVDQEEAGTSSKVAISTLFVRVTLQRGPTSLNMLGYVPPLPAPGWETSPTFVPRSGYNVGRVIFTGAAENPVVGLSRPRNFLRGTNQQLVGTGPTAFADNAPADWGPNLPPLSAWVFKDPRATTMRPSMDWPNSVSQIVERRIEWTEVGGVRAFTWWDINPADILIALLTNEEWGMKIYAPQLRTEAWDEARATLANDINGMSFVLDGSQSCADVVGRICDVIRGVVTRDSEGFYRIDLLRPRVIDGNTATTLSPSNIRAYRKAEKVAGFAEVKGNYFNPLYRKVQTLSVTAFSSRDATEVLEVDLFGIQDPDLAHRILTQRAVESHISPSTFEVEVAAEVASKLTPFEGVVLDVPGSVTPCYVMSVEFPDAAGEWATVVLQEAWDSTYREASIEELDPVIGPEPLPIPLLRDHTPYFHWARTYTGSWDFSTIIGEAGDNKSWLGRSMAYAKWSDIGTPQDGWRMGEKLLTSTTQPYIWTGQRWLQTIEITGSATRPLQSSIGETNLFVDDSDLVSPGHILRVPVSYPSLPFPDTRVFNETSEYVQVLEILGPQQIKVARGLFDTSVAPTIDAGEAWVIGELPLIGQTSGPWYAVNTNQWQDYATHGATESFPSGGTAGQIPVMDQRGLGVKSGETLPWDDGVPQVRLLANNMGDDINGNPRFGSRAVRPYDAGAAYADLDSGNIVVRFEGRNRALIDRVIPRGVPGSDVVGGGAGSETGRTYELWVFGDGVQVGYLDWTDITNSSFVITPGMLSNWGGPFTDLEFALAGVWRSGTKDVPSWQYTYLKWLGEVPGDIYNETAFSFGKGMAEAHESYQTPGAYYENAHGRGKGRVAATETLIPPPYMEGFKAQARARSDSQERYLSPASYVGVRSDTTVLTGTGTNVWTPKYQDSLSVLPGDTVFLWVVTGSTNVITASGYTYVAEGALTQGRARLFKRTVDGTWGTGAHPITIAGARAVAVTQLAVRGENLQQFAAATLQPVAGSNTIPTVSTSADGARVFSLCFAGHSGTSPIGSMGMISYTVSDAVQVAGSDDRAVYSRTGRRFVDTAPNGSASGSVAVVSNSSPQTMCLVHVVLWSDV